MLFEDRHDAVKQRDRARRTTRATAVHPEGDHPVVDIEQATHADSGWDIVAAMGEQEILRLVQALPIGYRTVFNMYAIEGYSHKEIADQLNITEGTSKSQLARARQTLQESIKVMTRENYGAAQ